MPGQTAQQSQFRPFRCVYCQGDGSQSPGRCAHLSFGASRRNLDGNPQLREPANRVEHSEAFLAYIMVHLRVTDGSAPDGIVEVKGDHPQAAGSPLGGLMQAGLCFCDLACLRAWFNKSIDDLEKMTAAESEANRRNRSSQN